MNPKFAVALMLALQVSMSLCELPTPSAELLQKYEGMRAQRKEKTGACLAKAYNYYAVLSESKSEPARAQKLQECYEELTLTEGFQTIFNLGMALFENMDQITEPTRMGILGLYEKHGRGVFKTILDDLFSHSISTLDCSCHGEA